MDSDNILQLVAQYAQLEARIRPLLPQIASKLVKDLLSTGTRPERLGKLLGKSPTYVRAIAAGEKSLTAEQIIAVVRHAATSAEGEKNA